MIAKKNAPDVLKGFILLARALRLTPVRGTLLQKEGLDARKHRRFFRVFWSPSGGASSDGDRTGYRLPTRLAVLLSDSFRNDTMRV